jgi:hypothetical protein
MDTENNIIAGAAAAEASKTIEEFCTVENIAISTYYKLKKLGLGPDELVILPKVIRITPQAHRDWHAHMKARAQSAEAQLEMARQRQLASVAGKRGAKSPSHYSHHRGPRKRRHGAGRG